MNEKQALDIIKAALDLGVQKGNFQNLNETLTITEAFNVIGKFFETKKDATENNATN